MHPAFKNWLKTLGDNRHGSQAVWEEQWQLLPAISHRKLRLETNQVAQSRLFLRAISRVNHRGTIWNI